MRILIIDNSAIAIKDGRYYTNALNGLFIDSLLSCGNALSYFQFQGSSSNNISSFDLGAHGVRCVCLKTSRNKYIRYIKAYLKAFNVIKKHDFVYLYYPNSFRLVTMICRLLHKPYGLYIRGMNGVNDSSSKRIYQHALTVFTVSDLFTDMVNETVGKEVAHTIRPMIPYTDADVVWNRQYALNEVFSLLFLGRIAADKGLTELMQAADTLKKEGRKFHLHVVGDGEFAPQLSKIVADKDLLDCVFLDGPVFDDKKKRQCYLNADLYVLPTYHEGFPRTLYEAMIFGTPVITTFVGGIPSLMRDGENCKRIEPRSADSIVQVVSWAMDHYDEMVQMAGNGSGLVARIVDRNRLTHAQHLNNILKEHAE